MPRLTAAGHRHTRGSQLTSREAGRAASAIIAAALEFWPHNMALERQTLGAGTFSVYSKRSRAVAYCSRNMADLGVDERKLAVEAIATLCHIKHVMADLLLNRPAYPRRSTDFCFIAEMKRAVSFRSGRLLP